MGAKEAEGLQLGFDFGPLKAPRVESIWEALGFTATSNNEARQALKMEASNNAAKDPEGKRTKYLAKYGYPRLVGTKGIFYRISSPLTSSRWVASVCTRVASCGQFPKWLRRVPTVVRRAGAGRRAKNRRLFPLLTLHETVPSLGSIITSGDNTEYSALRDSSLKITIMERRGSRGLLQWSRDKTPVLCSLNVAFVSKQEKRLKWSRTFIRTQAVGTLNSPRPCPFLCLIIIFLKK